MPATEPPDDRWRSPGFWELVCLVSTARLEEALALLAQLGWEESWVEQPLEHLPTADGWRAAPQDPAHVMVHVYAPREGRAEDVAAALRERLGGLAVSVTVVEVMAENWLKTWREGRSLVPLSDGFVIAPPWLAETAPPASRVIVIDPGLAFGAGDHPTTRDSALLLLKLLRPGDRVLDLGAGSGVLSILARRAGAACATAVEIDPLAAGEIARNAALNGVDGIEVRVGDAAAIDLGGPYDLLALNIGASAAKLLRACCEQVATTGARAVLSGLAPWAAEEVIAEWTTAGWTRLCERCSEGEWVTVGLARKTRERP